MNPYSFLAAAIIAIASLVSVNASAPEGRVAPHFEVRGTASDVDALPLKSTQVRTRIAGVIAEVEVVQTYANTGSTPLEAIYVFPASTRAAVQGLQIKVGDRIIKAEIQGREQAQHTYDAAKAQQKIAALLKQHQPNVLEMNVANIAPGAEVLVRLLYSEKLAPVERIYEWVLPGVIGPRYENGQGDPTWKQNPFLTDGQAAPAKLDVALQLEAGMPVQSLTSPSHELDIQFLNATSARASLKPAPDAANRDLVVRYQLADKKISSGLLLHQGEDENFFLLNVQPPARVTGTDIPARDYLFILDISGSMEGFPIDTAKQLMTRLLQSLRHQDRFNVLLFAGSHEMLAAEPLSATAGNIARVDTLIQQARSGGGTELLPALKRALAMPENDRGARNVLVITDGLVTVETEAFDLIRENLDRANVFTFGIGTSVNRHLLEGLARIGKGEPFVVTQAAECTAAARRFQEYVSSPLLTRIEVRAEGFDLLELEPERVPDLFADRPLEIVGKWKGQPRGKITIAGTTANGPYETSFDVSAEAAKGLDHPALRPLWARERARVLGDYAALSDASAKEALKTLGLKYGLLTEQTSFVAVDDHPQAFAQASSTVHQPSPLPAGVSQNAVSSAGSVPEPGAMGLLLMVLSLMFLNRRR